MIGDCVPIDEWANELTNTAKVKTVKVEAEGKPSLNRANRSY